MARGEDDDDDAEYSSKWPSWWAGWRPVWRAADVVKQMDEKEQFGVKRGWQRKGSPCVCMSQAKGIAVLDVGDDQKSAI